ncbi:MAG: response regulator [Eubacterium sp.]|jgi:hemerythrin-like metal-binding protein|nr:response regulator [Eubacterium sp.]
MGNQLVWDDRFNIGVEIIDKEHKKLFKIMNKLFTANEHEKKSGWFCQEGIKYFKDHAIKHFSEEEAYMESIGYQGLEMHKRLHEDFRMRTLPSLEKELEKTGYCEEAISHFLGVCAGWLIGHTLTEDHAIAGNEETKWASLLPEEEQEAVKQTILQLLQDMFRLQAQVISECYGGEKFGSGIYYRLIYATQEGSQREMILVFEEKLLIRTIGALIGSRSSKLDVTLMNAARYAAMQFAERIKKHFSKTQLYVLRSEHLLSYEQFQRTIEKENLRYSILFNTGEGYFAFCSFIPQQACEKSGTFIHPENEMTEVKKYLQMKEQENSSGKKKLLVVDDSMTVCYAVKGMLQEDYQIAVADSAVSAIRSITLERPDLVLLDYEMPVCDGAQILQMIRQETVFADIPVFFLTGKVDKASVSRVLPFKPEGYLLKSSKPEDIRRNIDRYFEKKH